MINFIDLLNWAATIFVWGLGAILALYLAMGILYILGSFGKAAEELLAWIFAGLPDYTEWQTKRRPSSTPKAVAPGDPRRSA